MLKISRLYSDPKSFEPIEFDDGINLILGEKDDSSNKTNGVGKSLSIEFINFALLKDFTHSRVAKIPFEEFPRNTQVCLDFTVNGRAVTSKRSIEDKGAPVLIIDGVETKFFNIDDASKQLTNLLFGTANYTDHPSFRSILGPLIRDERSEFKSIVDCVDTKLKFKPDLTPHLFLLGIPPSLYQESIKLQKEADNLSTSRREMKTGILTLTGKSFADAKADVNDLASQVEQIKSEMDRLESAESYELVRDEIIDLENNLEIQRTQQSVLKAELSKLKLFKGDNYIDESEVADLYERFREGLGEMIKREIQEVTAFKKKIDNFQLTLIESRRDALVAELNEIRNSIGSLDSQYKEKLSLIDQQGELKSLKSTVMTYQKKLEELSQLSSYISRYEEFDSKYKVARRDRSAKIIQLESLIGEADSKISAFEESILKIHEYVMGNRKSYFEIKTTEKKETVSLELRIYDDGSHSNEREKVFFYDMALLLTHELRSTHPGLLIHDNIFDVDQDTLLRSLNYLAEHAEEISDRQYILTLNSDKLHSDELVDLKLDLEKYKRAAFTKTNRFLGKHYQEM